MQPGETGRRLLRIDLPVRSSLSLTIVDVSDLLCICTKERKVNDQGIYFGGSKSKTVI